MKINNPPPPESAKNVGPTYVQPEVELPKPEPPQNVEPKKVEQTYSIMPNNSLSILGKRIEDLKQREKDAIVRYADANRRISEASMRGLWAEAEKATIDMHAAKDAEYQARGDLGLTERELLAAQARIDRDRPRAS